MPPDARKQARITGRGPKMDPLLHEDADVLATAGHAATCSQALLRAMGLQAS